MVTSIRVKDEALSGIKVRVGDRWYVRCNDGWEDMASGTRTFGLPPIDEIVMRRVIEETVVLAAGAVACGGG